METVMKHLIMLALVIIVIFAGYRIHVSRQIDQEANQLLAKLEQAGEIVRSSSQRSGLEGEATLERDTSILENAIQEIHTEDHHRLPKLESIVINALKAARNHIHAMYEIEKIQTDEFPPPLAAIEKIASVTKTVIAAEAEVLAAAKEFCAYVEHPEASLDFQGKKEVFMARCAALEAPRPQ
jgi:hypothetical protein